jgi:hypothetical protein
VEVCATTQELDEHEQYEKECEDGRKFGGREEGGGGQGTIMVMKSLEELRR